MKQISLFDDFDPAAASPAARAEPARGAQLDLFEDRTVLLSRARDALVHLEGARARAALREALARYPQDASLAHDVARLETLSWRVEEAVRTAPDARAEAFLAIAQTIAPSPSGALRRDVDGQSWNGHLWRAAVVRAANEAIARAGDAAFVRGAPPGELLLLAGDTEAARASLERALRASPRARFVACLGEHARLTGDGVVARQLYLSALRANPYDVDLDTTTDEDIAALPSLARHRFEIEDEPLAWVAAVGVVTGVFQLPIFPGAESEAARAAAREALSPPRREALARCSAFLDALLRSHTHVAPGKSINLTARRQMKQLAPTLFDAVMGRSRD